MKRVLVFGTFDGLHPGHINFFQQAKKLGDELIIVVARDATVQKVKGRPPRKNENARLSDARNAGIAGEVLLGNLGDPYAIIKQIKPDIIALGYDQTSFTANLESELKKAAISVKIVRLKPHKPEIFKSSLIK
ncbi:MAG TPA: FAD synthase [Candidatus Pacearchaeota archaeon]|jgi:FAD synthetase|nr:FAD synthase [Candidatus Pacearchaeota archaeon]